MKLTPFQLEVDRRDSGIKLLVWRRQAGKTTYQARTAIKYMLKHPGALVIFCSASLNVGREITAKEAQLFWDIVNEFRTQALQSGAVKVETTADALKVDDFLEIFDGGKFEVKIWHDRTRCSRTKVIAPNPATARGFTGFVMLDEIGFIPDFKGVWEAMEPIASRDPSFRVLMATTPPASDDHYSYEIAAPANPEELDHLTHDARGNWYVSEAGVLCHRVDVWDAYAGGVKLYDSRTRLPITPEEHRAQALDRDAWDRNYALKFVRGGAAACSLMSLSNAMAAGRGLGIAAEGDFPANWRDRLGTGPICIGIDPATTEKEKSNPTSIGVVEKVDGAYVGRLVLRYKTASAEDAMARILEACDLGGGRRARRVVIDATSERYFADMVRKRLMGIVPVDLVVSSERYPDNEAMNFKTYLGNQLVNLMEDNRLKLPESRWLKDDFRLVFKERGAFVTHVDSAGNHGDTFDAVKLAIHGFTSGGPVEMEAANTGSLPATFAPGWGESMRRGRSFV